MRHVASRAASTINRHVSSSPVTDVAVSDVSHLFVGRYPLDVTALEIGASKAQNQGATVMAVSGMCLSVWPLTIPSHGFGAYWCNVASNTIDTPVLFAILDCLRCAWRRVLY
jgi:hypothetical protein